MREVTVLYVFIYLLLLWKKNIFKIDFVSQQDYTIATLFFFSVSNIVILGDDTSQHLCLLPTIFDDAVVFAVLVLILFN